MTANEMDLTAAVEAARSVLADEGADTEGSWHSWRCFDKGRYPDPCSCTQDAALDAIRAALPAIREQLAAQIAAETAATVLGAAADEVDLRTYSMCAKELDPLDYSTEIEFASDLACQWLRERANRAGSTITPRV